MNRIVSKSQLKAWQKRAVLPSPLEADRFISFGVTNYKVVATVLPSPLEVNRFTSEQKDTGEEKCNEFPSPREADRFISPSCRKNHSDTNSAVSVPSRGYRFISKNG